MPIPLSGQRFLALSWRRRNVSKSFSSPQTLGVDHDATAGEPGELVISLEVRNPVEPLPDVRGTDAVCSKYNEPEGVTFRFQVSLNSIDPSEPNSMWHLFANEQDRSFCLDQVEEGWPEMSLVTLRLFSPCDRPGLTRERCCPNGSSSGKACEVESPCPSADSIEEKELAVFSIVKILRLHV